MPLTNLTELLPTALRQGIAIGAYNVHTPHEAAAAIRIHELFRAPCILQFIQSSASFMAQSEKPISDPAEELAQGAKNFCRHVIPMGEQAAIPVVIHLDHGTSFDAAKACIDSGFTSVMIDGSAYEYEANIALTNRVAAYAHARHCSVEAELGVLAGRESAGQMQESYTDPGAVCDFVRRTGTDCLAVSYGTVHGFAKGEDLRIREEIAIAAMELMRWGDCVVPLVSHGSSLVKPTVVEAINCLGGKVENAHGVPLEQLQRIVRSGIAKINVGTDLRLSITRRLWEYLRCSGGQNPAEREVFRLMRADPSVIDERVYLRPIRRQLVRYESDGDSCRLIDAVQDAVMETIGQLIVAFGYADTADLFTGECVRCGKR